MGLAGLFKMIREEKKKREKHLEMSYDDLERLPIEELQAALLDRMMAEEGDWCVEECLQNFNGAKRVFYIINYFNMEVQNGGLCQFFVNSSREVAPYLLDCLNMIGAFSYEKILRDFVVKNDISLYDLESFKIDDVEDFETQTKRYPFDVFDDEYYELYEKKSLDFYLIQYAKQHLKEFI